MNPLQDDLPHQAQEIKRFRNTREIPDNRLRYTSTYPVLQSQYAEFSSAMIPSLTNQDLHILKNSAG